MTIKKFFGLEFRVDINQKDSKRILTMDEIGKVLQRKQHINHEISDLRRRIGSLKQNKPMDIVVVRSLALKVTDLQKELDVIEVMLTS